MSVCPQCGSPTNPNDKFCNSCGFALAPPGGGSPFGAQAPSGGGGGGGGGAGQSGPFGASPYGPPPGPGSGPQGGHPQGGPYGGQPGGPPQQLCQQGHDIPPGQSYCAFGHPIAMDAMQFANDAYGGSGHPGPGQPGGHPFGAPPPQYGGQPQQDYGQQHGYGPGQQGQGPGVYGGFQPPPQQPYGNPQQGGFGGGAPFGAPPGQPPFGGPQGGGYPNPQQPPFGGPQHPQGAPMPPSIDVSPGSKVLRGFLVGYQSNKQGEFWPLHGGRLTVGRANAGEPVDIPLADATISSRHAALLVDNVSGAIQVEDTGSTNGTYVNDEHLGFNGRRELRDGDRLRFGGFTTIVKIIGQV